MKTYLLNQNGETIIKQINSKQIPKKTSLSNKLEERKKTIQQKQKTSFINLEKPKPAFINAEKQMDKTKLIKEIKKTENQILFGGNKAAKHKNVEDKQKHLFNKICQIVNVHGQPHGKHIPFDTLNDPHIISELFSLQDKLREAFPSDKLTSLHSTAIKKQSFPGVNIVRQIFKEMGYKLKPINISEGYLGSKKLLRREYIIKKI